MLCRLQLFCRVTPDSVAKVHNFLDFHSPVNVPTGVDGSDPDDSSEEVSMDSEYSESDAHYIEAEAKWLRNVIIASSPNMELVVFAACRRFVIMERTKNELKPIALVSLDQSDTPASIFITDVQVIPLASTRRTEASDIDWTCIAVSLSSGYVNFYTERGVGILNEQVGTYKVESLRFGRSVFPGNQELVALVAKGERSFDEINELITLNGHCLKLDHLRNVGDHQVVSVVRPCLFDQYLTASSSSTGLPAYNNYYCSTNSSFAVFLWHDNETNNTSLLQETMHTIAAQLPSIGFRSWLGLGVSRKDRPQKVTVADARPVHVNARTRLVDPGRKADRSVLAPRPWNLMAICDETARVLLVDTDLRCVLRVWKGYRNACCAFIETPSANYGRNGRAPSKALFLVIFAPKRAILEVWAMQNGPRVGAFNVDPKGKLLSLKTAREATLLGATDAHHLATSSCSTAVFLNSDGSVMDIVAPFHLAALDSTVAQLHDENLLKEFSRQQRDTETFESENSIKLAKTLKTLAYKKRLADMLVQESSATADNLEQLFRELEKSDPEENFQCYLRDLIDLCEAYGITSETSDQPMESADTLSDVQKALAIGDDEFQELSLDLLLQHPPANGSPTLPSFREFRQQFELRHAGKCLVGLKADADTNLVASQLFHNVLNTDVDVRSVILKVQRNLNLCTVELARLFHTYWLGAANRNPWGNVRAARSLLALLYEADCVKPTLNADFDRSVVQAENPAAALALALLVRFVDRLTPVDGDLEAFEDLHSSPANWRWLARNLSAMALLQRVNPDARLSLAKLHAKGYGFYREQVGKRRPRPGDVQVGEFVAKHSLGPAALLNVLRKDSVKAESSGDAQGDADQPDRSTHEVPAQNEEEQEEDELTDLQRSVLTRLQEIFPLSLSRDFCLCDCAWESASLWFKDASHQSAAHLQQAVAHLAAIRTFPRLQHGLALIIWDTFLRQPFQRLHQLVKDAKGALPSPRLLRREVLVRENDLPLFASCVRQFLTVLQQSVVDLEYTPLPKPDYEPFLDEQLKHANVRTNRKHTLVELAASQHFVNYHLVLHHVHLATVLELQLTLGLKLDLSAVFDSVMDKALFDSFHAHPLIPMHDANERMKERRQQFLDQVVTAMSADMNQEYHERWALITQLCREWSLDFDLLRIKEVKIFFESGFDKEAERLKLSVANQKYLAIALMPVALGRVKALFESDEKLKQKAQKRLRAGTWEAIRVLSDDSLPNFEVNLARAQAIIRTIINTLNYTVQENQAGQNEKRIMNDLNQFLTSLAP